MPCYPTAVETHIHKNEHIRTAYSIARHLLQHNTNHIRCFDFCTLWKKKLHQVRVSSPAKQAARISGVYLIWYRGRQDNVSKATNSHICKLLTWFRVSMSAPLPRFFFTLSISASCTALRSFLFLSPLNLNAFQTLSDDAFGDDGVDLICKLLICRLLSYKNIAINYCFLDYYHYCSYLYVLLARLGFRVPVGMCRVIARLRNNRWGRLPLQ